MIIRRETENDFSNIYELVKLAFQTAQVADGDEQEYVSKLRLSKKYIPELALVAEKDGVLIGHIMLTKTYIDTDANDSFEGLLLSPLCVALEHRNVGIGALLVEESFRLAKEIGYKAVFVVGDPAYYNHFGFRQSTEYNIVHENIPEQYVMAFELVPGSLCKISGKVDIV